MPQGCKDDNALCLGAFDAPCDHEFSDHANPRGLVCDNVKGWGMYRRPGLLIGGPTMLLIQLAGSKTARYSIF
jgi:hypothetical protein